MNNSAEVNAAFHRVVKQVDQAQVKPEEDEIRSEILEKLTLAEQHALRLFVRGVGEDGLMDIMDKLGVQNKVSLLHACYGEIEPEKIENFAKKHKLEEQHAQVLQQVLSGTASAGINYSQTDVFYSLFQKTGVRSLPDLFAAVHAQGDLTPRDLLTAKLQQVYDLRMKGMTASEIGEKLTLSENTAYFYLKDIHKICGVTSLEQLCFEHYGPLAREQLSFLGSEEFRQKRGVKLLNREIEFVDLAMKGFQGPAIARLMDITIKNSYHKSVFRKLDLHDPENANHGKGAPMFFARVHALAKVWAHWKPEQDPEPAANGKIDGHQAAEVDNTARPAP